MQSQEFDHDDSDRELASKQLASMRRETKETRSLGDDQYGAERVNNHRHNDAGEIPAYSYEVQFHRALIYVPGLRFHLYGEGRGACLN
jgi:hypothetical protein